MLSSHSTNYLGEMSREQVTVMNRMIDLDFSGDLFSNCLDCRFMNLQSRTCEKYDFVKPSVLLICHAFEE